MCLRLFAVAATSFAVGADADGPAFDRPGIAFSPSTLPRHAFAWEQGLPDFERDRADGVTQSAYAANTRLRYGLADRWEVQLAVPTFEQIDSNGTGRALSAAGTGDVSVAVKWAVTPGDGPISAAVEGVVAFPTGKEELSNRSEQYSMGATAGWSVNDRQSLALYANVDILDGDATWTVSPNWSIALSDDVGAYVEAGWQFPPQDAPANEVAGGGLTWLVRPTLQLDIFGLVGLTRRSTDLAAGWGISWYVP